MNGTKIILMLCGTLLLAAGSCTGTIYPEDDGGTAAADQFKIQSLTLSGTTQDACAVTVQDVPDEDGTPDQAWRVGFNLDGAGAESSLPVDTGVEQSHVLRVKGVRSSDSQVIYKKVTVTFYD